MSAKADFLKLAQHDPSILTLRHCTGDDIRKLAPLAGLTVPQSRRAFNLCLFQRTTYLTKSLDPSFEPQEHIRLRAKKKLDERARKKAYKIGLAKFGAPPRLLAPVKPSKLSRYSFD